MERAGWSVGRLRAHSLRARRRVPSCSPVLVGLYEEAEKPASPLEFVRKHLTEGAPGAVDLEELRLQNERLQQEVETLRAELAQVKVGGGDAAGADA